MVNGKLPDIIIYNADDKIITNAEIKVRADRSDGKRIPADIEGNKKICEELKSKFNKLVVFKSNIYHGLAYNEHKIKNKFRKNQVVFVD